MAPNSRIGQTSPTTASASNLRYNGTSPTTLMCQRCWTHTER
jgi:hypothetical protein